MKEPNEALAPRPARDAGSEPVWTGEAEKNPCCGKCAVWRCGWRCSPPCSEVLLTQVYLVTQASGNEMFPAVKDGDLVLGCRLEKRLCQE